MLSNLLILPTKPRTFRIAFFLQNNEGEETGMSGNLMANTRMNETKNTPKWLSVLITSLSHPQKQRESAQVLQ